MNEFTKTIVEWYEENKRELPWRESADPYLIWISEIILQQTRVAQGYDYFLRFIKRFPDVQTLAAADEDEVMKYWQGLGYYSRARNLHAAAKSMNGVFPKTYPEVLALKGVGEYTAAAICSFAYGMPYAVVDGNVYRVLSRYFGIDTPIDSTEGKKSLQHWQMRCWIRSIRLFTIGDNGFRSDSVYSAVAQLFVLSVGRWLFGTFEGVSDKASGETA